MVLCFSWTCCVVVLRKITSQAHRWTFDFVFSTFQIRSACQREQSLLHRERKVMCICVYVYFQFVYLCIHAFLVCVLVCIYVYVLQKVAASCASSGQLRRAGRPLVQQRAAQTIRRPALAALGQQRASAVSAGPAANGVREVFGQLASNALFEKKIKIERGPEGERATARLVVIICIIRSCSCCSGQTLRRSSNSTRCRCRMNI